MLTTTQKIGMTLALIASCLVLALVSFAAGWENMPDSQKEFVVTAGYCVCALLMTGAAAYCVYFVLDMHRTMSAENDEYEKSMANQFNVGQCISPRHWIDADDYRRFAIGSRK